MILLNATTKSFEFLLAGAVTANPLEWTLSAVELDAAFKLVAVLANDGVSNNTTAVVLLAAPAAGLSRQIKLVTIYNADTVAATVCPQLRSGANVRRLPKQVLQPGESYLYVS